MLRDKLQENAAHITWPLQLLTNAIWLLFLRDINSASIEPMESDFYNNNITNVKAGVKRRAADDLQSEISQVWLMFCCTYKAAITCSNLKVKLVCNATAKQVSAGVAPCSMVGLVKLFQTFVTRQVSQKVEPLSTSAKARNGCSAEKTRVSPCSTTS